jgi:hypothetical protein
VSGPQTRPLASPSLALPTHLYTRGLLQGRHSDITVIAFGDRYPLHRLILDQAPFFCNALSEPWLESQAKEITLHPEETDSNITQKAFELAISRLYGHDITEELDEEAIGLFAVGSWLEMSDLVDMSIESIVRQMSVRTLAPLIRLFTSNDYGRPGKKILACAKCMLCANGWEMPMKYWDGIPGYVVREIAGGDSFYVISEWDRWVFAKLLLDRRLRCHAFDIGLAQPGTTPMPRVPHSLAHLADTSSGQGTPTADQSMSDEQARWFSLYTDPDIESIRTLLNNGIHYIHFGFEQLEVIKSARDIFGLPVIPDKVLSNALWQQLALRQRVLNSDEKEQELGLSHTAQPSVKTVASRNSKSPLSQGSPPTNGTSEDGDSDEVGEIERPRKFWIPNSDSNTFLGDGGEQPETPQLSDGQAVSNSVSSPGNEQPTSVSGNINNQLTPTKYTEFPPFRFSAELPSPRFLCERKKVYSRTVSYAGSLWNIYIQKLQSSKTVQLGVYLHRARESERETKVAGGSLIEKSGGSVGQRMRELRRREMSLDRHRATSRMFLSDPSDDESSGNGDHMSLTEAFPHNRSTYQLALHPAAFGRRDQSSISPSHSAPLSPLEQGKIRSEPPTSATDPHHDGSSHSDEELRASYPDPSLSLPGVESSRPLRPTLPTYVDNRQTVKTYFRIYSPAKGGRMLNVFESAPDRFNFSQSWGWKSTALMDEDALSAAAEAGREDADCEDEAEHPREGKLRFMVTIGNL